MKDAKIIAHLQLIWNKRCYQYRIKISALCVTNEYVFDSYTWEKDWVISFQAKKKVAVDTPCFTEKETTSLVVTPLPASTEAKGTGLADEYFLKLSFDSFISIMFPATEFTGKERPKSIETVCFCKHTCVSTWAWTEKGRITGVEKGGVIRVDLYKHESVKVKNPS